MGAQWHFEHCFARLPEDAWVMHKSAQLQNPPHVHTNININLQIAKKKWILFLSFVPPALSIFAVT